MKMTEGVWRIPVPAHGEPVQPDVLLVPLLGLDTAGYRLGNGGGDYERTLAAMTSRPLTIGVGFDRLDSIFLLPYDIPMGVVVTESGTKRPA